MADLSANASESGGLTLTYWREWLSVPGVSRTHIYDPSHCFGVSECLGMFFQVSLWCVSVKYFTYFLDITIFS